MANSIKLKVASMDAWQMLGFNAAMGAILEGVAWDVKEGCLTLRFSTDGVDERLVEAANRPWKLRQVDGDI